VKLKELENLGKIVESMFIIALIVIMLFFESSEVKEYYSVIHRI